MPFIATPSRRHPVTKAAQQPEPQQPPTPPQAPPGAELVLDRLADEDRLKATLLAAFAAIRSKLAGALMAALRADYHPRAVDVALDSAGIASELAPVSRRIASMAEGAFGEVADMVPKRAVEWAQNYGAQRVVAIDEQLRQVIRASIGRGLQQGRAVEAMAAGLSDVVGLHPRWARAVENYRQRLMDTNLSPDKVRDMTMAYYFRLIAARALTIARTETLMASAQGRLQGYRELQTTGALSPSVTKEWLTAPSEISKRGRRVCPICRPLNHRKVKGLEGVWNSGVLSVVAPPIHPNCRCSFVVSDAPGVASNVVPIQPTATDRVRAVLHPDAEVVLPTDPDEREGAARAIEDFARDYPNSAASIVFVKPYGKYRKSPASVMAEVVIGQARKPNGVYGPSGLGIYYNQANMKYPSHGNGPLAVLHPPGADRAMDTFTHELGHILNMNSVSNRRMRLPLSSSPADVDYWLSQFMRAPWGSPHLPALWSDARGLYGPSPYSEVNMAEFFAEVFSVTRLWRNQRTIPTEWDDLVAEVAGWAEGADAPAVAKAASGAWPITPEGDRAITLIVDYTEPPVTKHGHPDDPLYRIRYHPGVKGLDTVPMVRGDFVSLADRFKFTPRPAQDQKRENMEHLSLLMRRRLDSDPELRAWVDREKAKLVEGVMEGANPNDVNARDPQWAMKWGVGSALRSELHARGMTDLQAQQFVDTTPDLDVQLLETFISRSMHDWAKSSANEHPRSLALHRAVSEHFGLPTVPDESLGFAEGEHWAKADEWLARDKPYFEALLDAVYENTQNWLDQNYPSDPAEVARRLEEWKTENNRPDLRWPPGSDVPNPPQHSFPLYRGIVMAPDDNTIALDPESEANVDVRLRPEQGAKWSPSE